MLAARKHQSSGTTMSDYSGFLRIELFTPDDFQSSKTTERKNNVTGRTNALSHYWSCRNVINPRLQAPITQGYFFLTVTFLRWL